MACSLCPGGGHEAPGLSRYCRWSGCELAACRPRAAASENSDHFLGASTASAWEYFVAAFEQRLGELGWIEGLTVAIEQRCADGRNDRYAKTRSRVCSAEGRRHCHVGQRSRAGEAGNFNDTDRVRRDGGPAWRRTGSLKRPLAHTRKIASDPKAAHFAVSGDRRTP